MEKEKINPEKIKSAGRTILGMLFLGLFHALSAVALNWAYQDDPSVYSYILGLSVFFGFIELVLIIRFAMFLIRCDEK
jgi:hypothetical protein